MTLSEIAIKRPVTMLMVLVSIIVLGTVALERLPLAFMPEIEPPVVFVQVPYENASPAQVERMIVRPLEEALGSVKGLREMWSHCSSRGGNVMIQYDWSTNMNLARAEVWDKIDRIRRDLPDDIGEIVVGSDWDAREAEIPIIEARLSSKRDLSESYDLLDRRIVKPLERVPGVARVRLDGVNPREMRINLRVADLERHRIDVRDVARLLRSGNFDQSLGRITEGDTRYALRTIGTLTSAEQIQNLVLRPDGLRLRDVADVLYTEPPLEYGRHLDGDFAVGITISQEARANTVDVCRAIDRRVAEMNDDPELAGVNFLVWFSQGREIEKTMRDLSFTGVFGAILAGLVLFGFLRRISTTLVAVACIPFSLIATCGVIWAQGKSLNTLSLLGLIVGIGMLVDNAVVVMENIFRHQELGHDQKKSAWLGSREVSTAVTAATWTSVIVFLPMIFNKPSEMNIYLRELALTICLTLLASLFISQTLIPLASSWFIKPRPRPRDPLIQWLERRYIATLGFTLRHRWLAPVIGLGVTASAVFPFMKVDKNFDAGHREMFVQVNYNISEELSLERKKLLVTQVEQVLEPHREELMARSIYSFWSDNWAMTRIYLREGEANEKNIGEVRRRLRPLLPEIAGLKLEVMETNRFWDPDRSKRIAFQLVGDDSEVLAELAEQAKERLHEVPGLLDIFASNQEGQQELHVELDRDLASRYGIPPTQLAEVVGLTYRGRRLPRFRTADGEREMRLTLDEKRVGSLHQLHNLPVWTAEGEKVPLASVATFREVPGAAEIQRDDRRTSIWVGGRYETGTRESFMPLVTNVANSLNLPYGYSWTFGDWQRRQQERSQEFLVNLLLALLLVYAVMASLFESMRQAVAQLVALPFALSGAVWTLFLTRTDFDQPAAIGLLLLIGIVVNNGIVMIEHINSYRRQGMPREEAMVRGGRERLRPIVMTAVTTLIGLVPIVVQKPSLGGVYYYSLALVIMGGLLISTFLTLVLLPTTASLSEDIFGWLGRLPRLAIAGVRTVGQRVVTLRRVADR